MDEQDLPTDFDAMRLTAAPIEPSPDMLADPIKGTSIVLHEPNDRAGGEQSEQSGLSGSRLPGDERTDDYKRDNGAEWVCPSSSAAATPPLPIAPATAPILQAHEPNETVLLPTRLIPDQPMPPGAPASLAAEMSPAAQPQPNGATHNEPNGWAREERLQSPNQVERPVGLNGSAASPPAKPSPGPAEPKPPVNAGPIGTSTSADRVKSGLAHPWKPSSPAAIAEFSQMWFDSSYTVDQIARRYRSSESTIVRWRHEFNLPPRQTAIMQAKKSEELLGAASDAINGLSRGAAVTSAMAAFPGPANVTVNGVIIDPAKLDPLKDPEIVRALEDIRAEARIMTAHSDLQGVQRKLMALAILAATKVPTNNWQGLTVTVEALQRAVLNARRIEAEIPASGADPVLLRREAAGQMMRELKSVLTLEEQAALGKLVKAGADRLMAKGASSASIAAQAVD